MQDAKEQPPPALPEDIVRMSKYKSASDENPRDVFWRLVEAYKEGGNFGEHIGQYSELREALVNIGCSVLGEEPRGYRVRASKTVIANAIFSMVVAGGWKDSLERLLSNLYQRKKGPEVNMLVAFGKAFANHPGVMGEWLKELLGAERPSEEVLSYILHAGDANIVRFLRAELLNIARTEINEPQVFAMESLGILLPGDEEVVKLFVQMMDDWDEETRKAALNTLKRVEVPEAGKKAVSMYPNEASEEMRIELEEIVARNREACRGQIRESASTQDGKGKNALCVLAKRVYGKDEANELVGGNVCAKGADLKEPPPAGTEAGNAGGRTLKLGLMMKTGGAGSGKKNAAKQVRGGAKAKNASKKRGAQKKMGKAGAKGAKPKAEKKGAKGRTVVKGNKPKARKKGANVKGKALKAGVKPKSKKGNGGAKKSGRKKR